MKSIKEFTLSELMRIIQENYEKQGNGNKGGRELCRFVIGLAIRIYHCVMHVRVCTHRIKPGSSRWGRALRGVPAPVSRVPERRESSACSLPHQRRALVREPGFCSRTVWFETE